MGQKISLLTEEFTLDGSEQFPIVKGGVTKKASVSNLPTPTKADIGLSNVDNTSDANKPISTATQSALDGKSNIGHSHTKADVGLGNVENVKNNYGASVNPASTDDSVSGYQIGSRWVNTALDKEFVCLDATASSAVWIETTQSGGAGSPNWGDVGGTLSNQTDLQAALDNKSDTAHSHTKSDVGLGNVDNTSDANKPISTATQTALNAKEDSANKGAANGYPGLDANSKVTASAIPSGIDLADYRETFHNYGTISSGSVTPSHNTNDTNIHVININGPITLTVPESNMTSGAISGTIEITGGDANAVTFDANWDWGDVGAPTLTAKSLIGYMRKFGDTKTKAWHIGGFL